MAMDPRAGLDFLMEHFPKPDQEPFFYPRPLSTAFTSDTHRDVYSKELMLKYFEEADWIDAKIGAYPKYALLAQKGKLPWGYVPKFWLLMIDQDEGDIKTTLHNIKMLLGGGYPTVQWTGHGYHIYLPLLITNKEILNNKDLAIQFMRFIERTVSVRQSDKSHNPSFNSCMLRFPGSYNQECILEGIDPEVKLIHRWDGFRVSPSDKILDDFMQMQTRLRLKELQRERQEPELTKKYGSLAAANAHLHDPLTEFLIFNSSGIADGRKNTLYYIIARYLVKIKGFDRAIAEGVCSDWCKRCNNISRIKCTPQSLKYHIKHCVTDAIYKHENPYHAEYLKTFSPKSYERLIAEYEEFNSSSNGKIQKISSK